MLGEHTFTLRGTFDALQSIEQSTGYSIAALAARLSNNQSSLDDLLNILYFGMKGAGNEEVTKDQLKEIIADEGIITTLTATSDFFAIALYGGSVHEEEIAKKN